MNLYLEDVKELSVGELYEMSVYDVRGLAEWYENHDRERYVPRPVNGTYVVYLGSKGRYDLDRHMPYYIMLSSEGKMYRVYNTDFVYGLKRIKTKV